MEMENGGRNDEAGGGWNSGKSQCRNLKVSELGILLRHKRSARTKYEIVLKKGKKMKIMNQAKEKAATGYILLWLLGIPIPILLLIFLLRGCT
jgi:hypothetical protein